MSRRERIAARLVKMAAWSIDRAYWHGQVKGRKRVEKMYSSWPFRSTEPWLLRLATWVDKEAAVTQMVEECWWG